MTTTTAAPTLDFVVFYVADLDESCRFFRDRLGFTHQPDDDSPVFRQFADGAGNGFGLAQAGERTPAAGEARLYYKTADLAALHERWTENGVAASPIVSLPFGKVFEIATPDGYTLTALE